MKLLYVGKENDGGDEIDVYAYVNDDDSVEYRDNIEAFHTDCRDESVASVLKKIGVKDFVPRQLEMLGTYTGKYWMSARAHHRMTRAVEEIVIK